MTRDQLDALETLVKKATAHEYGNDGKLRAVGGYLTTRSDISLNVEHLMEMGQKRSGAPLQAIPFADKNDAEAIAAVWNALPEMIAMARCALELEEALEFAASDKASLYKTSDGRYCCVLFEGGAGVEESFFGSTPLEAIQNARRAYAE